MSDVSALRRVVAIARLDPTKAGTTAKPTALRPEHALRAHTDRPRRSASRLGCAQNASRRGSRMSHATGPGFGAVLTTGMVTVDSEPLAPGGVRRREVQAKQTSPGDLVVASHTDATSCSHRARARVRVAGVWRPALKVS